jgi:hypothetical protein
MSPPTLVNLTVLDIYPVRNVLDGGLRRMHSPGYAQGKTDEFGPLHAIRKCVNPDKK